MGRPVGFAAHQKLAAAERRRIPTVERAIYDKAPNTFRPDRLAELTRAGAQHPFATLLAGLGRRWAGNGADDRD